MKKKNLTKVLALSLSIAAALSLAACGNTPTNTNTKDNKDDTTQEGNNTEDKEKKEDSASKTEISVIAAQYGQNTADWWKTFETDFEKDNEGIDLNVEVISWNDISTTVNTRVANNQAPDILNIDVFADYQADDLLLPAKDYVSEETYNKMYEAFLEQSNVDGTIWAIPDLASARAMYYNKDILEGAGATVPTTWEELTETCKKIKEKYPDVYPWGIDMTTDEGQAAFAYYIWNNGGDFVDADGNWTLNSPENVAAIEYAIGLIKDGYTNTDPANETRYDLQDMFGTGKVAMMIEIGRAHV